MTTYTHFDTSAHRVFNAPAGGTLLATMTEGGGVDDVARSEGTSYLQYNVVDLDVNKYVCVGDSFLLKFTGGARIANINQPFSNVYSGGTLGNSSVQVDSPVKFRGYGLTTGLEGTWKFWHGWGLYGRGRFGLMSGQFDQSLTETVTSPVPRCRSSTSASATAWSSRQSKWAWAWPTRASTGGWRSATS